MNTNIINQDISDEKNEFEREILLRLTEIKKSLSEIDKLTKLMMKCWKTEEAEMFFFAYNEFKNQAEFFISNYEKESLDYSDIINEISDVAAFDLDDNIIS